MIRAQHRDTADIFEVIPQEKLQGDLPTAFVYGHVHWLNLSTSVIEIRSLEKPWEQSLENWRIDCASGQYCMYKGCEWLVDIRSPTWGMVASRLKRLDAPENLVMTTFPINNPQSLPIRRLSIALPRYGLSFFVNESGDLESRDFRDMVYDKNQCAGTLFGLENRLVLRPNSHVEEELVHRCIIIPDGHVSRKQRNHHVHVTIDIVSAKNTPMLPITYHTYNLNTDLGCLTGYVSWRSKLYLAHLHALASVDWWPDPLTGRTGIQEALCLLRSAGCRSIMELDTRHKGPEFLLSHYYKMYPQLSFAVGEINYLVERERFLRNNQVNVSNPPQRPQPDVVGALRTAYLFPSEEVGPMSLPVSVGHPKSLDHEDLAYTISLAIYLWLVRVNTQATIDPTATLTVRAPTPSPVAGVAQTIPQEVEELPLALSQDSDPLSPSIGKVGILGQESKELPLMDWQDLVLPSSTSEVVDALPQETKEPPFMHREELELPPPSIGEEDRDAMQLPPRYWQDLNTFPPSVAQVEALLREARNARRRFRLLFFLTSIVFRQKDPWQLLSILIALTRQIMLKGPPHCAEIQRLDGSHPSQDVIRNCFANAQRPCINSPDEDLDAVLNRLLIAYWPSESSLRILMNDHFYDVKTLNAELQTLFSTCYQCNFKHRVPNPATPSQRASNISLQAHSRIKVTLSQLLRDRSAPQLPAPIRLRCGRPQSNGLSSDYDSGTLALNQLFTSLRINKTAPFQQQYIARLHDSARHAREASTRVCGVTWRPSIEELQKHYVRCRDDYLTGLTILKRELGPKDDPLGQAFDRSGQWPYVTPDTLFRCLASASSIQLPEKWKKCLVSLAFLLVELQRSRRLLRFALDDLEEELCKELENEVCEQWSAEEHPDWLLIQVWCPSSSVHSC